MRKIDLHIHTTCSDGFFSPKEIVDMAIKNNVDTIAISDHDTTDAYTEDLFNYCEKNNVKLINAVEISTRTKKVGIHVLGYSFDLNNQNFKNSLKKIRNSRHDYLHNVAIKLNELGYKLNVEKLDKIESVTKAHIALDIISNEENSKLLLNTFGHIPNKSEFIETIMNENCPAYVLKTTVTPAEAAKLIRGAGGIVVLAHPVAYAHEDNLSIQDIQKIVDDMNPDGIEANYLYVDKNNKLFNDCKIWNDFAKKNHLFVTLGSDFHYKDDIKPEIGQVNEVLNLNDAEIEKIIKNVTK